MPKIEVVRTVVAPVQSVFDVVSNPAEFAKAQPQILSIEFLSEQRTGKGTKFRETRMMGRQKASTVLEIAEYEPPRRVRMLADAGGTIWDTVFTVGPSADGRGSELRMEMEARAYKLLAKVFNPLISGMIRQAVAGDMDRVKAYCEKTAGNTGT